MNDRQTRDASGAEILEAIATAPQLEERVETMIHDLPLREAALMVARRLGSQIS